MVIEAIISVSITFLLGIIIAFIVHLYQSKYIREEKNIRLVEDASEIRSFLLEFKGDPRLEEHCLNHLEKSYMEVSSIIRYKRKPKTNEWKEISETIIKVNYYIAN